MAEETPPVDEMQYEKLAQDALRGVIRSALERAASPSGIPGGHHFYITFKTRGPGVSVPPDVIAKYPDEMTVVLQHQYWDLAVEYDLFSVMLKFGGMPKVLTVPYTAVTRFYDPSVQFLLQFEAPEPVPEPVAELPAPTRTDTSPSGDDGPKVVSLDQFRKK
ncbi:MAG: stringent starvation protein B [Brevundimonas subvibrioides]|uniref:Stringent starvation protein B n=1 Tax=Brevundimonas subvibrioides TaxID=74313 RepID=A0A258HKI0_9CAUL|nr:ClpXP protease specificity-enhancing factor SspB [Brevundimonas subvibrioides]OYX56813.1 MAG: stringent starvation protein B [Brevundimonas subvibrioides]